MEFLRQLFSFFKKPAPPSAPAPVPPPSVTEVISMLAPRVLLVVYDPLMSPVNQKLSQLANWGAPETLAGQYINDLLECSDGRVRYQIVERIEVNEFPPKVDGFRYTPASYAEVQRRAVPAHDPDTFNYNHFLDRFDILQRIADRRIDEVWMFGFPFAGFHESVMGGPGAFFCNASPLTGASRAERRFVIMGFSYERGVGEMLEAFGHRAESIMEKVYERTLPANNLWKKFIRYDQSHPGLAECGNVHFAPNSQSDYDWGNPRTVISRCDDWHNFPNFKGLSKPVNKDEWGGGDIRLHHRWWFDHFPRVSGSLNGISNNWWQYIVDPNRVNV